MIRCAHCKGRHGTVSEVRECAAAEQYDAWQAEAEAELRNERYFEEGPEAFQAVRFMEEQEENFRLGL